MQFLKHDAELVRLLERSDSEVARARSNDDLLQIIDNLKSFKGGLTFDHALPLVLLLLAIVSAIPAMAGVICRGRVVGLGGGVRGVGLGRRGEIGRASCRERV